MIYLYKCFWIVRHIEFCNKGCLYLADTNIMLLQKKPVISLHAPLFISPLVELFIPILLNSVIFSLIVVKYQWQLTSFLLISSALTSLRASTSDKSPSNKATTNKHIYLLVNFHTNQMHFAFLIKTWHINFWNVYFYKKIIIIITIKVSSTIRNLLGHGHIVSYIHVPYIHAILDVRMTIVNMLHLSSYIRCTV